MADLQDTYAKILAAQSGGGATPSAMTGMGPSTAGMDPSRFSFGDAYSFGLMNNMFNQGPMASEAVPPSAPPSSSSPTGNTLGDIGMALGLLGSGLRGDMLPGIAVMQQMEQRKQQAALIAEKKRQQEEQKRQHDVGMVDRIMTSNLPSGAKFDALDKLRREIPWAGTMADGLKDAHIQNFQVLKSYIPPEVVDRVTKGQSSAGEISAWADYAQEAYKVDAKEKVREQAYDTAAKTPDDQRSPSQRKLIEEQQADLELKRAESELKTAQAGKAAQPDTELVETVDDQGKPVRILVDKQTGKVIQGGLPGAPPKQPLVTIDQRQQDEFEKELGKEQAKQLLDGRKAAEESIEMLNVIKMGRELLASPMITGFGAESLVTMGQALKQAGFDVGGDALANTQAYSAAMAQNVGKIIKQFGAGSGLSDADREYAEKMAAGKVTLEKKALEKIIDINERAARNVIRMHNKKAKGVKTNIPLLVEEPPQFKLDAPKGGGWSIKPVK